MKRALLICLLACGALRGQDAGALWAVLAGGSANTSDGYVTDGLILRYDGIRNTRAGHNASATTWEDLSGSGADITLRTGVGIASTHLTFSGTGGGRLDTWKPAFPNGITFEVVSAATTNLQMGLAGWANMNTYDKNKGLLYYNTSANYCSTSNTYTYAFFSGSESMYKTNYFAATRTKAYINARKLSITPNFFLGASTYPFTIGESYIHPAGTIHYKLFGKMFAVRIYNRTLTDEECMQNRARDMERFGCL